VSTQNFRQCVGSRCRYTNRPTVLGYKYTKRPTVCWVTVWVHRSSERMLVQVVRTLHARHTIASQTRHKLRTDGAISCLLNRQNATVLCPPPHLTCPYFRTVIPSMWVAKSQASRVVPTHPQIRVFCAVCRTYTTARKKFLLP
jgi:hypothetical protein